MWGSVLARLLFIWDQGPVPQRNSPSPGHPWRVSHFTQPQPHSGCLAAKQLGQNQSGQTGGSNQTQGTSAHIVPLGCMKQASLALPPSSTV